MKCKPKPGLPRLLVRPKHRQRNIIERMFGWLKESRRIVTRFDKLARSDAAMVSRWLVPCDVCDIFFRTEPNRAGRFEGKTNLSRAAVFRIAQGVMAQRLVAVMALRYIRAIPRTSRR